MAGCMIAIKNRDTGARASKLVDSREEAIAWIAGQLNANSGGPDEYWIISEPAKVYKTTADLPWQPPPGEWE